MTNTQKYFIAFFLFLSFFVIGTIFKHALFDNQNFERAYKIVLSSVINGFIEGYSANNFQSIPNVVKIIHQSWKNLSIPHVFEKYRNSWTKFCYKDWKYIFWTDEDNLNLIKTYYPWFLKKYTELPANIYRADVSRYFYLFHFGGIYTDMDNECLKPFTSLLENYSLVFGAMVGQYQGTNLKEGYVQNSFMYSRPRLEFWLELIIEILNFKDKASPELYTGPVLLSKKINEFRTRRNVNNELIIYPPYYFNPFSWIDRKDVDKSCKSSNAMTDKEYQECRSSMIKKGSYVVQYHAHTWG